jgi:MFS family permease
MMVVLDGDDHYVVLLFALTILTAPAVGALLGGFITTKIGGYTNRRALVMCFILFLLMTIACIPMSFVNSIEAFSVCVWFIIFTQGFIEPVFTGILLNTVSKAERATASSVSIFLMMIFGLLPAPYAYGLIADMTAVRHAESGDNVSRWGMRAISFTSVIGCVALGIALLLRRRSYKTSLDRVKQSIRTIYRHLSEDRVEDIIKEAEEEVE